MIKVYGIAFSRAYRTFWMLEELGLDYEVEKIDFREDDHVTPEYLAVNPNGKIPTLVDGELKLFESLAINFYLASRYGKDQGMWPATPTGEGLAYQWSFWAASEIEMPLFYVLWHGRLLAESDRDPAIYQDNLAKTAKPFGILNAELADKAFLAEDRFTVADLNLASIVSWAKTGKVDLTDYPNLAAWLERCLLRPAAKKAMRAH